MARILVIDDERDVRETLAAYLDDSDHEVLQAGSGQQGIQLCREEQPDLVICDLRMPGMDGLAVLAVVSQEFPETPFLVLSGMGRVNDAVTALKNGAWDYLTKPVQDMAMLEHAINQALEKARLRRKNHEYQRNLEESNQRLEESNQRLEESLQQLEEANQRLNTSLQQLEEDEAAGRRIQFQLLPQENHQILDYTFNRHLLTSMYLSGDFVDYFPLDEGRIGFYIADVSGHGVSSALVTVLLKSYMSRYLELFLQKKSRGLLDPALILSRLNHNILKGKMSKYLTMFYGIIDRPNNCLHYANGGQFPCPILYDGQQAQFIGSKNVPVGLFEFAEYQAETIPLPKHFTLTLISDGILEVLPHENLKDKLAYLLEVAAHAQPSIGSLLQQLGLNQTSTLPDDITLLLINKEDSRG